MYLVDVKLFYWISENTDLLVATDGKSEDHQSLYGLSSRDCAIYRATPLDGFGLYTDISSQRVTIL